MNRDLKKGFLRMQVPNKSEPAFFRLDFCNVFCFRALRAIDNFKANCLTFGQCLKTIPLNGRVMDKNISAIFLSNESKAFGLVEPFNGPFYHPATPP